MPRASVFGVEPPARAAASPCEPAHQIGEHDLELRDQLHHAANDLAGEVLVALRQQHLGKIRAHLVQSARAACRNSSMRAQRSRSRPPRSCGRESAATARAARAASRAVRSASGHGLLHQVERAMRRLVGELSTCSRRWRASGTSFSARSRRGASRRGSAAARTADRR